MSFVSELIVADEEVVVAGGVLSEQPTTVIRAQAARRERTRFFIGCLQLAGSKPNGQSRKNSPLRRKRTAGSPRAWSFATGKKRE
jgi:hypothetical protein